MIPIPQLQKQVEALEKLPDDHQAKYYAPSLRTLIVMQERIYFTIAQRNDMFRAVIRAMNLELASFSDNKLTREVKEPPWYTERCAEIDDLAIDIGMMRAEYDRCELFLADGSKTAQLLSFIK